LVFYFILKLPADKIIFWRYREIWKYWFCVSITVFAATLLCLLLGPRLKHHFDFAIAMIAAGMTGLLVASSLFKIKSTVNTTLNKNSKME
jgi:hypothetical protein